MRDFNTGRFSSRSSNPGTDLHLKDHERRITNLELSPNNSINSSELLNRLSNTETRLSEVSSEVTVLDSMFRNQMDVEKVHSEVVSLENIVNNHSFSLSSLSAQASKIPAIEMSSSNLKDEVHSLSYKTSSTASSLSSTQTEVLAIKEKLDSFVPGEGGVIDLSPITDRLDILEASDGTQDLEIADHEARLSALELGGGGDGGTVDLGPVLARVTALETSDAEQTVSIGGVVDDLDALTTTVTGIDNRLAVVEAGGGGDGGGPGDLTAVLERITDLETNDTTQDRSITTLTTDMNSAESRLGVLETSDHSQDTSIRTLTTDLKRVGDRVTALEDAPPGGGGGDYDDTELRALIAGLDEDKAETFDVNVLRTRVHEAELAINDLETAGPGGGSYDDTAIKADIVEIEGRLDNLEEITGTTPPAKKYYILPLAGQSNMLGFGEIPMPLDIDKRIWQLGYSDSFENQTTMTSISKQSSGFGERYRELRPMEDSCLKILPATWALDTHSNMHWMYSEAGYGGLGYKSVEGGLASPGMYFARALMPYIPEEYDILIVNVSMGGSGFTTQHSLGSSYDAVKMRASRADSFRWGKTTPLGRAFYDRVEHALSLNPENRLLPFIWMQGEDDKDSGAHYTLAKEFIMNIRDSLVADGHESKFPYGTVNNFRWLAMSPPKKYILVDDIKDNWGVNLYDAYIDYDHNEVMATARANYDNYAFMGEDPDFQAQGTKYPQVRCIRCDLDQFGRFYHSSSDDCAELGTEALGMNPPDWHYATATFTNHSAQAMLSAVSRYGTCLAPGPIGAGPWTRPVKGQFGMVTTDGVQYMYDKKRCSKFDADEGLTFHQDYHANTTTGGSTTGSVNQTIDPDTNRRVASFTSNSHIQTLSGITSNNAPYTVSIGFKILNSERMNNFHILCTNTSTSGLVLNRYRGSVMVRPSFNDDSNSGNYPNFALHKYLHGAWNGQMDDWQYFTFVYNPTLKVFHIYCNGCLVESLLDVPPSNINNLVIANTDNTVKFKGRVSDVRVYNRCLNSEEVASLYYIDMEQHLNKVKMTKRLSNGHGGCTCGNSSHDTPSGRVTSESADNSYYI